MSPNDWTFTGLISSVIRSDLLPYNDVFIIPHPYLAPIFSPPFVRQRGEDGGERSLDEEERHHRTSSGGFRKHGNLRDQLKQKEESGGRCSAE